MNAAREILARDLNDARSLVSQIANLLYDDLLAKDRERWFYDEGGAFAEKIAAAATAKVRRLEARLARDVAP